MQKIKEFYKRHASNTFLVSLGLALILNIVIEGLARKDVSLLIDYIVDDFFVFVLNTLIIFASLSIAILFRRRVFMLVLVSAIWLAIGIANGVILSERMTPFTTGDLLALKEGVEMAIGYMEIGDIILYLVGVIVAVLALLVLFIKAPKKKEKVDYRKAIAGMTLVALLTAGGLYIGTSSGTLDTFFPNLAYGYRDNGVPYCFLSTWLDRGVDKPDDYSEEMIESIFTEEELASTVHAEETTKVTGEVGPNVIFVQLESVIDPYAIDGIELSKDPIPNIRAMLEEKPSGLLTVPSMGAGTANTEFELMTGFSAKLFGPGEYPYKSILTDQVTESYAYVMKELGYGTHAIHNHRGVFYNRNTVFANMGYDTFTSLEFMNGVEKTEGNWAKDEILTGAIVDALESTEESDYIYTIAVEGHGRYSEDQIIDYPEITVETELGETLKWQYEHYVNLCYETDKFVGDLVETVENLEEDTIVVMYGDHLPAIEGIDDSTLIGRNMYQTDYFIFSNYGAEDGVEDKDYAGYQLAAEVLDLAGINEGTMTTLHQNHSEDEDYLENLAALQYDILYGDMFIYDGVIPFVQSDMQMGVKEIKIDSVEEISGNYYIKGENFNEYSKVNLDGEILDTFFISSTMLGLMEEIDPSEAENMKVSQVESENEILSTTE